MHSVYLIALLAVSCLSINPFTFSSVLKRELSDYDSKFINWAMEHQANYLTVDELNFRKALFEANQALVD